jgi:hypothetical protein
VEGRLNQPKQKGASGGIQDLLTTGYTRATHRDVIERHHQDASSLGCCSHVEVAPIVCVQLQLNTYYGSVRKLREEKPEPRKRYGQIEHKD